MQQPINNKTPKVCILTSVHSAFDTRIFHKEAKTLVKAGYDVTLIAQHDKDEVVDGIKIIALSKPKNRFLRIFLLTRKIYKIAFRQKSNIYHFHDPELVFAGILLKIFTKARVIYDVHEDVARQILSKYYLPGISRKLISILFNWFEKLISRKFNCIITATPDIKENFKNHNVIDIKNYMLVTSSEFSEKNTFPKNKNYYSLIYVGGLERIRGIKEIIQSLKFINPKYNVKLKIAGRFFDKRFEKEIESLTKGSEVEFLGRISFEEVIRELSNADIGLVCLHPLRRFLTSLPVKIFEYMSAGLPVIASDFPLWRETIEDNNCGLTVPPLNPREIAKAIEYLIEHPDNAKKFGENGRKAVFEQYNWEIEKERLLTTYKKLTKKV